VGRAEVPESDNCHSHSPESSYSPVTPIDSPRILIVMSEIRPGEDDALDPLEQLLDQESDEEFGLPEFKEHLADTLTPAVLKDWSAADFASIYVRFKPHLERHAKRFLVNPSQVEEVVQDAFLYLMTTLPELDSELGVLKFLKWKTRLLALDVIRANSRASFAPIDDQPEIAAKGEELSLELERADDAAIVALALAKLQPRHREALIATLYEEKSSEVVAAQMGLNENAFRQLLFRARSSFKKALVGEAETQGKSISEILSIAARKAAKESGKYLSAAGAFLLVLAISIGVIPNLNSTTSEQIAQSVPQVTQSQAPAPEEAVAQPEPEAEPVAEPELVVDEPSVAVPEAETIVAEQVSTAQPAVVTAPAFTVTPAPAPVQASSRNSTEALRSSLASGLGSRAIAQLAESRASVVNVADLGSTRILQVSNFSGLSANFELDLEHPEAVTFARASMEIGGASYIAVPRSLGASTQSNGSLTTVYLGMSDFLIADATGELGNLVWEDVPMSEAIIRVAVTFDAAGNVIGSQLSINR